MKASHAFAADGGAPDPLKLWDQQPAGKWTEARALGHGRLGTMAFGGPAKEPRDVSIRINGEKRIVKSVS